MAARLKTMEAVIRTRRGRLPNIGHHLAAFVYKTPRRINELGRMSKLGGPPQISEVGIEEESDSGKEEKVRLSWKDYVALAIATLETVLLPLVLLVIVILALVLLLR